MTAFDGTNSTLKGKRLCCFCKSKVCYGVNPFWKWRVKMKTVVVITSIWRPTEAVRRLGSLSNQELEILVVGDNKTPTDWQCKGVKYMSPNEQHTKYPELSTLLGWNTVDRRNLGYLEALRMGADVVAYMDDDNLPYPNWNRSMDIWYAQFSTRFMPIDPRCSVFDPLSVFGITAYHRGFPVDQLNYRAVRQDSGEIGRAARESFGVVAGLWDDQLDVDALQRIQGIGNGATLPQMGLYCSSKISPFNYQNTFINADLVPYAISIPFTGRMCDIWGAYWLQAVTGCKVAYVGPTVVHSQMRYQCSLVSDLQQESLGYLYPEFADVVSKDPSRIVDFISEESWEFMKLYIRTGEEILNKRRFDFSTATLRELDE